MEPEPVEETVMNIEKPQVPPKPIEKFPQTIEEPSTISESIEETASSLEVSNKEELRQKALIHLENLLGIFNKLEFTEEAENIKSLIFRIQNT